MDVPLETQNNVFLKRNRSAKKKLTKVGVVSSGLQFFS